ncbi:hypothetical protein [Pseudomonas solani]|uniref:hypothetical protein n=1 Tax=Pseudomonas solani TaxID=2731552 RepID=UPI003C2B47E2
MKTKEVKLHRDDHWRVELDELLSSIPDNDLDWHLLEYDGVGKFPIKSSMTEFCDYLESLPYGMKFDWRGIRDFAAGLDSTNDCLLVAISKNGRIDAARLAEDDYSHCEIALRAFDSSTWTLCAADHKVFEHLVCKAERG